LNNFIHRGGIAALAFIALFILTPTSLQAVAPDLKPVLSSVYGADAAAECSQYYSQLDLTRDEADIVEGAVKMLAEAGFPFPCPRDYLRMVTDLSRAGIELGDLSLKIQEAVAKKVEARRLIKVLDQRTRALQDARVVVLDLEGAGVDFIDKQMAYTVFADYLLRGVPASNITKEVREGNLDEYPALDNLIR
jgi:hypothetical protein